MVVNVEVKLIGVFQRLSGKKRLQVKLEKPATVRILVTKLAETLSPEFKHAFLDGSRPNSLILVGGREISVLQGLETSVRDSEEVVLVPMAHGG
jgi:molybdopterin converting factor small subunit